MSNLSHQEVLTLIKHGIIVFCDMRNPNSVETKEAMASLAPFESITTLDGSMTVPNEVAKMATTFISNGAVGVRVDGLKNLAATRAAIKAPIIASVTRKLDNTPVCTTPFIVDIEDLAQGGADIIVVDGTARPHPVPLKDLLAKIHEVGCMAMADCSSLQEALDCQNLGFDMIGTRVMDENAHPDPQVISSLTTAGACVIAEDEYRSLEQIKSVFQLDAYAVVISSQVAQKLGSIKI